MNNLKLDIHTHILPPEIPKFKDRFGYGGFIELLPCGCSKNMVDDSGKFFRKVEPNCFDPKVRIKECETHGVTRQVLSTIPVMFSYFAKAADGLYVAEFLNDHLRSVMEDHPDKFYGLGTLPMQSPTHAVKELERLKKIGLQGVQIGSNINGKNLNEPELFEIFEACAELSLAVFVHPWEMMGEKEMQKYWLPWLVGMPAETSRAICSMIFGGVLERLPKLRVAFAHGGGSFPLTIGRIEHGFQVRPDLCALDNKINPRDYLGKFWIDSLVHDPKALNYILEIMGEDKVALGTDYPFPLGELEPGSLIANEITSKELKEKLLYKNGLEWLGVSEDEFRTQR
jgi:aminocarboxymuconate-semialdehyde decarboxylase